MSIQFNQVAIITTVANFDLYRKTSVYFPPQIARYVIDGTNGMYSLDSIFYMFKKLKGRNIEWLIMADEDVVFHSENKIFDVIEYMKKNNFHYSGIREGGVISHRMFNPHAINTFFSVLHFSEIEKKFDKREIKRHQFIKPFEFMENLHNLERPFDEMSLFEPYYCFYFWLKRNNFNFLSLNADLPFSGDPYTTAVYGPDKNLLLYHTWYARAYNENISHTARINKILNTIQEKKDPGIDPIIFKDLSFKWRLKLRKGVKKIYMKMR